MHLFVMLLKKTYLPEVTCVSIVQVWNQINYHQKLDEFRLGMDFKIQNSYNLERRTYMLDAKVQGRDARQTL